MFLAPSTLYSFREKCSKYEGSIFLHCSTYSSQTPVPSKLILYALVTWVVCMPFLEWTVIYFCFIQKTLYYLYLN